MSGEIHQWDLVFGAMDVPTCLLQRRSRKKTRCITTVVAKGKLGSSETSTSLATELFSHLIATEIFLDFEVAAFGLGRFNNVDATQHCGLFNPPEVVWLSEQERMRYHLLNQLWALEHLGLRGNYIFDISYSHPFNRHFAVDIVAFSTSPICNW